MMDTFFFLILSAICLVAAINVLVQKHPIYSALSLIVTFTSLAGIYLQMQAEFIAMMQIVVYTGAIMVLFVFVIMLLGARATTLAPTRLQFVKFTAIPLSVCLSVELAMILRGGTAANLQPATAAAEGNTEAIGRLLYSRFALPLEVASVLLLAAILGVIVLAKKEPGQ